MKLGTRTDPGPGLYAQVCVSPSADHAHETVSSLEFGSRAMAVKTTIRVNETWTSVDPERMAMDLQVRFHLASAGCAALAVLCWLRCAGCAVLAVLCSLCWLCCAGCAVLAVRCWLRWIWFIIADAPSDTCASRVGD